MQTEILKKVSIKSLIKNFQILGKKVMRKGIHPENYRLVAFKDMSNEDVFITKSTAETKETLVFL